MAKNVTLLNLRTRVRYRADAENDTHVSDAEINEYINSAYSRFYDKIVASSPPDYFRTTYNFSTAADTVAYSLPSDFYKLRQLYAIEDSTRFRPLRQVDEVERGYYSAPDGTYSMRLDYIPVASTLSSDSDTIDGVNGWDEMIVLQAAIDVKDKKEDDPSSLYRKLNPLLAEISSMAPRDWGSPRHVVQTSHSRHYWRGPSRNASLYGVAPLSSVDGYTLVGSNVELYRFNGVWGR